MTERESLFPFSFRRRTKRSPNPQALVRQGPPTPDSRDTWEVAVDDHVFAVFNARERINAVDFANGFNLGARWRRG